LYPGKENDAHEEESSAMNEVQAKKQLKKMLRTLTAGSILHLLADVFRESAEEAKQDGDIASEQQFKRVEDTLFVVGLGVDAAIPQ
jgi:hypothetical protein